jgi:segregation and condensation protein A
MIAAVNAETDPSTGVGTFAVELPAFSGPFRTLADLILEQRVDVCDVSIARVTQAFIERVADADAWSLEEATWFLAVSAMLLELKVGRLMPRAAVASEEDLLGGSPDLAYARSLELAAFRRIQGELGRRIDAEADYYPRDVGSGAEFAHLYPDVMERVSAGELASTAARLLRPQPALDLTHVTPIRFTVDEAMRTVQQRLGEVREAAFRDLVADCAERMEVVVRFLALLELYREGKINVSQAETFGELRVTWAA